MQRVIGAGALRRRTRRPHGGALRPTTGTRIRHTNPPHEPATRAPRAGPATAVGRAGARQRERERAAHRELAPGREVAAHPARQVAADRQPEPRPLLRAGEPRADLHERLEGALELVGRDPPPGVGHAHGHLPVADGGAGERHPAAGVGELDGVGQEVEHHLLHLLAVGARRHVRRAGGAVEGEPLGARLRGDERLARGEHLGDRHVLDRVVHRPGVDLGVVEHPVDEPQQVPLAALDALERLPLLGRHRPVEPQLHQLRVAGDGGQRGAQLVAHHGQELALGAVRRLGGRARRLGRVVEGGAGEGGRGLLRDGQQQRPLVGGEGARPPRAQHERADDAPVGGAGQRGRRPEARRPVQRAERRVALGPLGVGLEVHRGARAHGRGQRRLGVGRQAVVRAPQRVRVAEHRPVLERAPVVAHRPHRRRVGAHGRAGRLGDQGGHLVGGQRRGERRRGLLQPLGGAARPLGVGARRALGHEQPLALGPGAVVGRDVAVEHRQPAPFGRVGVDGVPHVGARVVVRELHRHPLGHRAAVLALDLGADRLGPLLPVVAPDEGGGGGVVEPRALAVHVRHPPVGVERDERVGHPLDHGRQPAVVGPAVAPRRHAERRRPVRAPGRDHHGVGDGGRRRDRGRGWGGAVGHGGAPGRGGPAGRRWQPRRRGTADVVRGAPQCTGGPERD